MTRIIIIALLTLPFLAAGQDTLKKPRMREYTYITPEMSKKQLDSLSLALRPFNLYLNFDKVVYDNNKRIKEISGALDTDLEYFPISSTDFKGITIISRGENTLIVMGLFHPARK
jgi:hypothetical protein